MCFLAHCKQAILCHWHSNSFYSGNLSVQPLLLLFFISSTLYCASWNSHRTFSKAAWISAEAACGVFFAYQPIFLQLWVNMLCINKTFNCTVFTRVEQHWLTFSNLCISFYPFLFDKFIEVELLWQVNGCLNPCVEEARHSIQCWLQLHYELKWPYATVIQQMASSGHCPSVTFNRN